LARVIATTTYHRFTCLSRCAYSIARTGVPILERAITIYDREAHAHGLHARTAHRQISLSSHCAECRTVQDCAVRESASRTNAPPLSGRVVWLPAWCAGNRRRGLKYSPLCHIGRSGNNNNIELGATRYFVRHAWWSSWLSCSFSATSKMAMARDDNAIGYCTPASRWRGAGVDKAKKARHHRSKHQGTSLGRTQGSQGKQWRRKIRLVR
jgi:hypothetical protein